MGAGAKPAFEIRVGLVMFGGLSLAVYMNGVVQELLALVRASQLREEGGGANEYWPLLQAAGADFVIDVIAGTSAGGLNGLVLAKALATGSDEMSGLSDLWRSEAQIDKLVQANAPRALLTGDVMEEQLEAVMKKMSANPNLRLANKVKVLDLFVTATDLRGREVKHKELFRRETIQVRNQHLFHLKKRTLATPGGVQLTEGGRKATRGYNQNDFWWQEPSETGVSHARDRLLALIGRATSAFPGVLPTQRITRADAQAAQLAHLLPDLEGAEFWFSDGGILMNKPFAPVVRTIFQRSADKPVDRVLLWVDPDPVTAADSASKRATGEPHLLQVLGALPGMLTNEDVVSHLEAVQGQNEYRQQLAEGFRVLERRIAEPRTEQQDAAALDGYRGVRALWVRDGLKKQFRAALMGAPGGGATAADLLAAAVDAITEEELLRLWDWQYQVRRLHYLLLQLDQFVADAVDNREKRKQQLEQHLEAAALAGQGRIQAAASAFNLHRQNDLYAQEQEAVTEVRRRQDLVSRVQPALWNALEDWRNARWVITNAWTQKDDPAIAQQVGELLEQEQPDAGERVIAAVRSYLQWVEQRAQAEVNRAWELMKRAPRAEGDSQLLFRLQQVYAAFEERDILLLPMTRDGNVVEWDQIDPVLMAPGPTRRVNRSAHSKLASEAIGHMGGFLDERWRSNDILWGRLETAELLCDLVVAEASKHLSREQAARLTEIAEQVVADRHRTIMQQEKGILDYAKLKARYAQTAANFAMRETAAALAVAEPAVAPSQGWLPRTLRSAGKSGPTLDQILEEAPPQVLWDYLTLDHSIGTEGIGAVRKSVLVKGVLQGLDNLIVALGRNREALPPALKGVQGAVLAVLRPTKWLLQVILPWQGPLGVPAWACGMTGGTLLLLHFAKAVTLHDWALASATTLAGIGALWLLLSGLGQRILAWVLGAGLGASLVWGLIWASQNGAPHQYIVPAWGWAFAGLLAAATVLMGLFGGMRGSSPRAAGIIKFELAGSLKQAEALIAEWEAVRKGARERAAFQVGVDFLYLAGYAPLLALLVGLGAELMPWGALAAVGRAVAWAQLLAGAFDAVENVGLMKVLAGTKNERWPRLARSCAIAKFTLVGLAVPFLLIWLGTQAVHLAGPTVTVWAQKLWP